MSFFIWLEFLQEDLFYFSTYGTVTGAMTEGPRGDKKLSLMCYVSMNRLTIEHSDL